jgi:adenylate cyclase
VLVEDTGSDELAVVGLPRDERYDTPAAIREALLFTPLETAVADTAATLPPAAGHSHPAMSAAVSAWAKVGKPETAFRFQAAGEPWWGGFHSYPLGKNTFRIGVVVPEQDFLGDVIRQRNITLAVSLVALAVALAMALAMARTYGRPLESLADSSRRIRGLDLDEHAAVESTLAEITQLAEAQQQMLSTLQSFAKYVPMEVVRELLRRGEVAQIGGTSESLTILFTDISGFTTIAEALGPEALTDHMADYFHEALTVLERHEATVDKLIGDAIVAFWGAPRPDAAHADHALAAVLEIQRQLAACNARWRQQGLPELHTRFGLATGRVIVGNVGARSRLSYTVLGDTVNLAARLEGINKFYGTDVLVSEEVRQTVTTPLDWRLVDLVAVKGKRQGKRIYEPLGPVGQTDRRRLDFARRYELAWAVYQNRQFGEALAMIETLQQDWPDDVSLTRLRQICAEYQQHPPPEDWDGVARMVTK